MVRRKERGGIQAYDLRANWQDFAIEQVGWRAGFLLPQVPVCEHTPPPREGVPRGCHHSSQHAPLCLWMLSLPHSALRTLQSAGLTPGRS